MQDLVEVVFTVDVVVCLLLVAGALWSIGAPQWRIWPPPGRRSWQYYLTWVGLYVAFAGAAWLLFLDWDSGTMHDPRRLLLGVPLVLAGGLLSAWGVLTLGLRNTSGVRDGFVRRGPYRFTRNPQYLGTVVLLFGLGLVANSFGLWISHGLLILVFLMTPWCEEPWLQEQYGEVYEEYRRQTPRFL